MTGLEGMAARVAVETGLDKGLVLAAYRAYWQAVREHVCSIPLKEGLTYKELLAYRPCVNIPRLGKLAVTEGRYAEMTRRHKERLKEKETRNAED